MVNRTLRHFRRAFTMLELIFAIVIIGLVALTIPTILLTNARNVETNLLQEAVLIAATKMGQTMSYPWDEHSRDPGTLAATDVLTVSGSGNAALARSTEDFRIGHFQEPLRRRMTPSSAERFASTTLGMSADANTTVQDDIDDIDGTSTQITGPSEEGYKATYTITGSVVYISDAATYTNTTISDFDFITTASAGTTNIKMVQVSVDSDLTGSGNDIVFRAWSSNIGETDFYKRTY
jgi:prepilin-type N-terminal cleavage/methylation domain-containing protein